MKGVYLEMKGVSRGWFTWKWRECREGSLSQTGGFIWNWRECPEVGFSRLSVRQRLLTLDWRHSDQRPMRQELSERWEWGRGIVWHSLGQ